MQNDYLLPPNLGELGLPRRGDRTKADLLTIWLTPYPVITSYKRLAARVGFAPFAGGTMEQQGEPQIGYVTSGYRDLVLNSNIASPHRFALALDMLAGDIKSQIEIGRAALTCGFTRVGLYPERGFIHVDVAPSNWIARYRKERFWVNWSGKYRYFHDFEQAAEFAASI